ncbi:MAG TPA: ABC transporter permease, partial [Ktedonobacteraceae bacterium]|nr:ABC transporter permease [Ktedonobacteraceae bacterium]
MEWHSLVLKQLRRNLRRYLGYLLAGMLAVVIFSMFSVFVSNPGVQQGEMPGTARELLVVCRVIVALFAVFFIFYFHSMLIRLRNKEFGLLLTLGMRPGQIGRMIFLESLLIGFLALLGGCVLGGACSQLFLLAMSHLLALARPLPLGISPDSMVITLVFFSLIFLCEAAWTAFRVSMRSPRMLILGSRVQQTPPQVSAVRVVLGLLCLGTAYGLALFLSKGVLVTMIPIAILTISATHLLFSQVIVLLLKRWRGAALSGTSMLIVARLAYRIRDYARMLTIVTVLNVAVITSMGGVVGALRLLHANSLRLYPSALQLASNQARPVALTSQELRAQIQAQHLDLRSQIESQL